MTPQQKALFFFQLANLLNSGLTVQQSLSLVGKNSDPRLGRYLKKMIAAVTLGDGLAVALQLAPRLFDRWTISLIRVAEMTGTLPQMCQRLADLAEQEVRRRKLYRSVALAASTTLFNLTVLAAAFLYTIGIPFWTWLVLGLLLMGLIILSPRLFPRLPIVYRLLIARSMIYLGELELPLRCGISILTALELVREHIPKSNPMRATLTIALGQIPAEKTLSQSLEGRLPAIALQMIRTGEKTGHLDTALQRLTDYYTEELERTLKQLQGILVPMSILIAGAVVLLLGVQALKSLFILLPS